METITLYPSKDLAIKIRNISRRNKRSVNQQCLFWLLTAVQWDAINNGRNKRKG